MQQLTGGNCNDGILQVIQYDPSSSAGHWASRRSNFSSPFPADFVKSIPRNEYGWQQARQRQNFDTEEVILSTLSKIEAWSAKESHPHLKPHESRCLSILFIADCCVELYTTQDKERANSTMRAFFKELRGPESNPSDESLQRIRTSVIRLIALMDELYTEGMEHRAFEAVLLHSEYAALLQHKSANMDQATFP